LNNILNMAIGIKVKENGIYGKCNTYGEMNIFYKMLVFVTEEKEILRKTRRGMKIMS